MSTRNRRRNGRHGRQGRRRSTTSRAAFNGNIITRVPFSDVWQPTFTASGTLQSFGLLASNSGFTRLNAIGASFEFFRFIQLDITILPFTNAAATTFCMSFANAIDGVTPITTFAQACEQQPRVLSSANTTIPINLKLDRRSLLTTPERWFCYNTNSTVYSPIQGELHLVPSASTTQELFIMLSGIIEFCRPSPAGGADRTLTVDHVRGCKCNKCC